VLSYSSDGNFVVEGICEGTDLGDYLADWDPSTVDLLD